jgi:hypothetical protein
MSLDRIEKGVVISYIEPKVAGQQGHEFERKNQSHLHHKIPEKRGNLGSSSALPPRLVEEEAQGLEESEEMSIAGGEEDAAGHANVRGGSSCSMKLRQRRRSRGAMQRQWAVEGRKIRKRAGPCHRIVAFFCSAEPTYLQRR